MENRLKRKLADGTLTFCLGVNQARTPNITMIAAAAGFDAIYVDLEHNPPRWRPRRCCASRRSAPPSRRWCASARRTAIWPRACWMAARK
jgi:hypothetical protein